MEARKKTLPETAFWKILLSVERALMATCSVMVTLLIVISVIMRYIFKSNFYGSEEIILVFAFWLYFLGAVHGSYENSHIKADLLNVYLPNPRVKEAVALTAMAVTTTVNIIITKWAFDYMVWGFTKMPKTTGLKIPLVVPQSAIFVGLVLMAFYHIYYLVTGLKAFFNHEPPVLSASAPEGGDEA